MMDPTRVTVARFEELQAGTCRMVAVAGREIGVIRLPSGTVRAVLNRCPHRGAPVCRGTVGGTWPPTTASELAFARRGEILVCPWHGREFDLVTGAEVYQDSPGRLKFFPVEICDGAVIVLV